MKIRTFFIAGVMGIAVISGIIKGLASHRAGAKKEEEEETADKEGAQTKRLNADY